MRIVECSYPRRVTTTIVAVFRRLIVGCRSLYDNLDPAGGKSYRRSRWLWALFDDGGTLSPPLPSLLVSSRQVAPDGHAAEAQMLGDLSDGQALLAE